MDNTFAKEQAKILTEKVYDLIEKVSLTRDEEFQLVQLVHTSNFYWSQFGDKKDIARSEWLISRSYAKLEMGESALFHAVRTVEICKMNDIDGYELAFAFEAVTRAYHIIEMPEKVSEYREFAMSAAMRIENEKEKQYTITEIASIK